ncbi:hypothetical protein [Streptomyces xanthophaeus]
MAELVAAGAPELPLGHFYRIEDTNLVGLRVEIRRRRRWFGSVAMREAIAYVHHEIDDDARTAVVSACIRAHERWRSAAENAAKYRATTAYAGDHDPKGGPR